MIHKGMSNQVEQLDYYTGVLKRLMADGVTPEHELWFQFGIAISKIQQITALLLQESILHTRETYNHVKRTAPAKLT